MVFDLNGAGSDAAYKIGHGKPFGFGSIRIATKLFVERADAYTDMIGADGWTNPLRAEVAEKYLSAFKNYIRERKLLDAWSRVMKELNAMLDWRQTEREGWSARIKSMSGNVQDRDAVDSRFKTRTPLPSVFDVVNDKYKI